MLCQEGNVYKYVFSRIIISHMFFPFSYYSFFYLFYYWMNSERKHTEDVIKPDSGLLLKILIHVIGISALNVYNCIWPHIWMTRTDLVEDLDEWNIFINLSWLKWFWPFSLVEWSNDIFFCTVGFLYRVKQTKLFQFVIIFSFVDLFIRNS